MMPKTKAQISCALTSKGSEMISYSELVELQEAAIRLGYVVQSVEAFESFEGYTRARLDATFSYPHSIYSAKWSDTVLKSKAAFDLLLSTVKDREKLIYRVWLDDSN
jgi:hypothetical protein